MQPSILVLCPRFLVLSASAPPCLGLDARGTIGSSVPQSLDSLGASVLQHPRRLESYMPRRFDASRPFKLVQWGLRWHTAPEPRQVILLLLRRVQGGHPTKKARTRTLQPAPTPPAPAPEHTLASPVVATETWTSLHDVVMSEEEQDVLALGLIANGDSRPRPDSGTHTVQV
ncbi:UNVERIFIED_CONTAM: hypothetical protein FKN15_046518 [Acipenser sinensis]